MVVRSRTMNSFSRLPLPPPKTETETLLREMYLTRPEPSTCGTKFYLFFLVAIASSSL